MKSVTKGEMTRKKVVEQAKQLVNRQGFNNTSIRHIIEATGVKKGNLYFHFPSKEALSTAVMEHVKRDAADFLRISLKGRTPGEKLSHYLDAVLAKHRKKQFVGGCLIGNTAIESGDANPHLAQIVKLIFDHWQATLANIISEAMASGEIRHGMAPEKLALHMIAAIEGGIMIARVSKDENDLKTCLDALRSMIGLSMND